MTHVGPGGDYVAELTYKFVGAGHGDFDDLPAPSRNVPLYFGIAVCALLLVGVFLLVLALPAAKTSTMMSISVGPSADCLLWGDPHVETFDHSFPNFYGAGEYWLVKEKTVWIQARFLATPYTNGLATTHQISVGGPFMNGHSVAVGPLETGQITCDGQPILQEFPSKGPCAEVAYLDYNSEGKFLDNAQGSLEKRIVHIELPERVHIQVMRWANHINLKITMHPRLEGQDGYCGNFNGEAGDDGSDQIRTRMGSMVAPSQLLFHHESEASIVPQHLTIADCRQQQREHAMQLCRSMQPQAGGVLLDSCIFDVCFGGDQYAGDDGLAESEA